MAEFGKNIKSVFMRGMEMIGNTANNIAANTRYKVSEMNLLNRKEEILAGFGNKAYELYQKGATFPPELMKQLEELVELDAELQKLHAEHIANAEAKLESKAEEALTLETAEASEEVTAAPEVAESGEETAAEEEAKAAQVEEPENITEETIFTDEMPQVTEEPSADAADQTAANTADTTLERY